MAVDLEWRVQQLEKIVEYHDIDLYKGRGKLDPPLTERTSLLEDIVGKLNKNLSKIVWLIIATLISVVAGLIFKH